jgi:hypothetical protein
MIGLSLDFLDGKVYSYVPFSGSESFKPWQDLKKLVSNFLRNTRRSRNVKKRTGSHLSGYFHDILVARGVIWG